MSSQRLSGLQMWNELVELAQQAQEWPVSELSKTLGTDQSDLKAYLRDISKGEETISFYEKGNHEWVKFDIGQMHFILPLNFDEWRALKDLLNSIDIDPALEGLKENFLSKNISSNTQDNLAEAAAVSLYSVDSELMQILQICISEQKALYLETTQKTLHLFPNRLIHLEGELCLIAEDVDDHCLLALGITEILGHRKSAIGGNWKVSNFEVEEFITAIRSMNDQETRLILKIHDPDSVNLFPDFHFLGKPCMVKNPNGDLIWAAYVEPCSHLFEWLISLGRCVEILDPVSFKQEYLNYCEEKLRNIA